MLHCTLIHCTLKEIDALYRKQTDLKCMARGLKIDAIFANPTLQRAPECCLPASLQAIYASQAVQCNSFVNSLNPGKI